MTDIKDRVAEAIVKAQTELEQALSDLDQLPALDPSSLAYAAHALNNYLTVTGGTAELLLKALANHPDPKLRVWVEGVQQATGMMSQIVTGLMSNASISSAPRLLFTKVDLTVLVQKVCDFYQRKADHKRIRIIWRSRTEEPFVWADRVAVAAVMDNIFSNAVKYSPQGKEIWVTVRREPGFLICSVQDEGPGLSKEDQSKLFQKGVRLSSVPTGGEAAMGYGLAVAKELMDLLGGAIWCESELGQGACFSIRIPEYREKQSDFPAPSA